MKKMKLISGLMAMAMAAMSLTSVVSAADVAISAGNATAKPGDSFKVDVSLASLPSGGVNSIEFAIGYDSSVLNISKVSLTNDTGAASKEGDLGDTVFTTYDTGSQYIVLFSTGLEEANYWVSKEGAFVTVEGTVASGTKATSSTLSIEPVTRSEYPESGKNNSAIVCEAAGTATSCKATNGTITIQQQEETTSNNDPSTVSKWGDADCNGEVDISDVIFVSRVAAEDKELSLSAQGKLNSDCNADSKINGADSVIILQLVAKLLNESQMPYKG